MPSPPPSRQGHTQREAGPPGGGQRRPHIRMGGSPQPAEQGQSDAWPVQSQSVPQAAGQRAARAAPGRDQQPEDKEFKHGHQTPAGRRTQEQELLQKDLHTELVELVTGPSSTFTLHSDYLQDELDTHTSAWGKPPGTLLASLQPGGQIWILAPDGFTVVRLPLMLGDAVWFDGTVLHAGSSYENSHVHPTRSRAAWRRPTPTSYSDGGEPRSRDSARHMKTSITRSCALWPPLPIWCPKIYQTCLNLPQIYVSRGLSHSGWLTFRSGVFLRMCDYLDCLYTNPGCAGALVS
eukprot:scaffold20025_cov149-Isochrysis_galbana.AAC.8